MFKTTTKIIAYGVAFNALRMLIGGYSAIYVLSLGAEISDIAYLKALQAAIIIIVDIPLGYFADRYSRRLSVFMATICASIWMLIMGFAQNISHIYLAEIFNAISLAFIGGAFTSILIDAYKQETTKDDYYVVLGQLNQVQFFAMAIAALVGGLFLQASDPHMWIVGGVGLLIVALFTSWLLPKNIVINSDIGTHDIGTHKLTFYESMKQCWDIVTQNNLIFKAGIASLFLISVIYQILIQFWQIMLQSGLVDTENAIVYSSVFVLILIAQSLAGKRAAKSSGNFSKIISIFIASVVIIQIGMNIGIYTHSFTTLAVILVLAFYQLKYVSIVLDSEVNKYVPPNIRATLGSVFSTVLRAALIITMPILGYLSNTFGVQVVSIATLIISVPAITFYWYIFRNKNLAES